VRVVLTRDFLSGLLFLAVAGCAIAVASRYPMGTAAAMGPGAFPILAGGVLACIGLGMVVRSLLQRAPSDPVGKLELRPLFLILASIVAFSMLIDKRGLIVAIAALLAISHFASRGCSVTSMVAKFVVLSVVAIAVFVYGLGIPLRLSPF
jgi:Tripartite tricarboxylate transporter TctB family